jgi:hypothetical protein
VRSLIDAVLLRRSDEQADAARFTGQHEHDGWDVPRDTFKPARKTRRARCFACEKPGTHHGYCRPHWCQVLNGVPVDEPPQRRGRKAA